MNQRVFFVQEIEALPYYFLGFLKEMFKNEHVVMLSIYI